MNFVDTAKIFIKSGDGGNGAISFRREKYVPKGGPDGGNGGRGGDVVFRTNPHLNTLLDFRYKKKFIAQDGANGRGSRWTGRDGEDAIVQVPPGTVIRNAETGEIIADLTLPNHDTALLVGGMGGRGNSEFATAVNQAPRHAEDGKPGEEVMVELELKLLADVGLVGFPNAGKSTLISVISAAKPKIADYPFTTLIPNLGMVRVGEEKSFTVADIPGLIEGAHTGRGLGTQFLRHVERTRVLVFLIDANSDDHLRDYEILRNELRLHNPDMEHKKRIVCISKLDTTIEEMREFVSTLDFPGYGKPKLISSVTRESIDELVWDMWNAITQE